MKAFRTNNFEKTVKKLHESHKKVIDDNIEEIEKNPLIGESKKGDLAGVRVYKFSINRQEVLLAYKILTSQKLIALLHLGSHENFYRDLKKKPK